MLRAGSAPQQLSTVPGWLRSNKDRDLDLILFRDTAPSGSDVRDNASHDRVHLPDVWQGFGRPMTSEGLVSNGWSG